MIVTESFSAPRLFSVTAWRHDLSTRQLFNRRRLGCKGTLTGEKEKREFVPALVVPDGRCDTRVEPALC